MKSLHLAIAITAIILSPAQAVHAQEGAPNGEWHTFGGDLANTKYSALDQINRRNFKNLEVAFAWESISSPVKKAKPELRTSSFKTTPLMVDGILYVTTALSQAAAIDAGTGETIWTFDPKTYENLRRPANLGWQHRGVAYWDDGGVGRIILATHDLKMIALHPKTGELFPEFGENGIVDTSQGLGKKVTGNIITHSSPATIVRDTIVLGHVVADFAPLKEGAPGHVRGYDPRTGKMKWMFHTIPREGQVGIETWENDSWKYTGAANVWTMMAADEELGYVYLSTGTSTSDFYGGHRHGSNLFAESIVCVNAETGERVWHFQAIHHGLWDYDFTTPVNLMDIKVDGKEIKALAQVGKQAFAYVLNRETGEPVWPIEERAVPQSTVPGEKSSPTQPFPTKPAAFDYQGLTEDDLIDFTPELLKEAKEIFSQYAPSPLFAPPTVDGVGKPVIQLPGDGGGVNWQGAAFDPETDRFYVPSYTRPVLFTLTKPDPARSNLDLTPKIWAGPVRGPKGLPLMKPPYGRVTAIDMRNGEHEWVTPHGDGPKNHPAIKHLSLPALGAGAGGPLVTKTLLFVNNGGRDMERGQGAISVYDKKTGLYLGKVIVPGRPAGNPITYMHEGKQYIAVATGGGRGPGMLYAFKLP